MSCSRCGDAASGLFGGVAQLGERTVRIRKVESSILFVSTITHRYELCITWYKSVFAIDIEIPQRK